MNENETTEARWSIDKRIPIAMIAGMLIQTSAIIWWAGRLDSRVETLESRDAQYSILLDRMTRTEEKLIALKETTSQINAKMELAMGRKH